MKSTNVALKESKLVSPEHVKKRKNSFIKDFKKNWTLLALTLPMVIFIFIFSYIPMFGVIIAFKNFKYNLGIWKSPWVGFRNFELFFTSPDAWRITRNTVGYNMVFIFLGLVASVAVALLLYEVSNRLAIKTYQTVMFFPHLLSWVVVSYMAYSFLNVKSGMLNQFLTNLGLDPVNWYYEPKPWIFIFPIANLWKGVGMGALFYYASLLGIDTEYFEAASIEGANKWQITTKITLPFLYPLMIILTTLSIGRIFNSDFGLFYQLPMDSTILYPTTDVIETYVFRALTESANIPMASAAGLYKSFVGFVLVILTNFVVRKLSPENSLF